MEQENNVASGQLREVELREIQADFRFLEIPDGEIPEYTTAQEFSKRFRRCSVLQLDEVRYAPATGATM